MVTVPGSNAGGLETEQRLCGYYVAWFFKCYMATETGWWPRSTPDGRSIADQDSYLWRALEVVAQVMNEMRAEDIARSGKS
jgi:hypothetical protein